MATPYTIGVPLDLTKNELQNAIIQNLATAPGSPTKGRFYFDTATNHLYVYNGTGWEQASGGGGSGTVTSVSVVSANGFAGSVATATTTPAITITTTATGLLKGNGTAISAAVSGTDYAPATTGLTAALKGNGSGGFTTATLNDVGAATAAYSLNSQRLTSLADPVSPQDAVTKNYVDTLVQGLTPKPSATVATTAALPSCTYGNGALGVGATLTGTSNGALAAIDGYTASVGDVILVKNQVTNTQNGLYVVTQIGDGSHPFILTRHVDMDVSAEITGAFIVVTSGIGSTLGGSMWVCTSVNPIMNSSPITFSQLNGATQITNGTGITIAGNVISISTSYVGQTSITTLGTITTGTWSGTAVAVASGGTGATTAAAARTNLNAEGKYSALIGDGTTTSFAITQSTHGLASNATMDVVCYNVSTGDKFVPGVSINDSNGTVTISFSVAPTANQYRITISG